MSNKAEESQFMTNRNKKQPGPELALLLVLAVVVGGLGLMLLTPPGQQMATSITQGKPLMAALGGVTATHPQYSEPLPENFNEHYEARGQTGGYTLAVDPATGKAYLYNDNAVGSTSNNTSVEGSRRKMAEAMVRMDRYAEDNRKHLSPKDYKWYKDTAAKGMSVAFGQPGGSAAQQKAAIDKALNEFQQKFADRPESVSSGPEAGAAAEGIAGSPSIPREEAGLGLASRLPSRTAGVRPAETLIKPFSLASIPVFTPNPSLPPSALPQIDPSIRASLDLTLQDSATLPAKKTLQAVPLTTLKEGTTGLTSPVPKELKRGADGSVTYDGHAT